MRWCDTETRAGAGDCVTAHADFEIAAALDMLISGVLSRSREDRT
jgi:hypothetical protein